MGISLIPALFMARHAKEVGDAKLGLVLGRQKLHMKDRKLQKFCNEAAKLGIRVTPEDCVQPDGFTETIYTRMGYPHRGDGFQRP